MSEHFTDKELACHHCGRLHVDPTTLARLERVRVRYGKAMYVSSFYRCPEYDKTFGGHGRHPSGHAVDILVCGADALLVLQYALEEGFTCVGVSQKGQHGKRFLHLDDLTETDGFPSPALWSY